MDLNRRIFKNAIPIMIVILLVAPPALTFSSYTATISIDCNKTDGHARPFSEINSGPLPIHYVNGADITSSYRAVGINFVRTHDFYGPTDISTIFPDFNADPSKEESYNFSSSDYYVNGIVNAGCQVFYRLGESASDNESLHQPPANFSKWAEICKHVVMHYNDGWDNGYHYNITYWEIWNEPDLNGFWNGTAQQYYALYETTARTLKEYNESLKVGGPCTSSVLNENYTTAFLEYVAENSVPLNFFSWHLYDDSPSNFYEASRYIRKILDRYGFTECENINTEWNTYILLPQREKDNARNAAFTASVLTLLQDAGIDYAFRYRGTQDNNWLARILGFDLSLFTADGTFKRPALSYLAMHYLARDTPVRLSTPTNVSAGITCLAGIAGDRTNISILISNYDGPDTECNIAVGNLPWDSYRAVHYLIDEKHHLEIIEDNELKSSAYNTTELIEKNSVHFIRLTNSTAIPDEGPQVASIPLLLRLPFLDPIFRIIGLILLSIVFG